MKFIHTGDWHLGRLFHNLHLTDDQRFTLEGLLRLVEAERAEALVISGDVFDRAVPPIQAVELLDDILAELALRLKVPVVMIAGNHDSPVRLQYLNGLVGRVGVHVVGEVGAEPRGVALRGRDGVEVVFWPLAYTDPETARCVLACDDIHTHQGVMEAQISSIRERMHAKARHVLVGHAFVTGATTCESERPLTVGGTGEIPRGVFEGFDYAALGHLHRPQSVSERVRYAGSLLKYSFDEADHHKSVTVVELGGGGSLSIKERELPVRRDLVRLRGPFSYLLNHPEATWSRDAYVEVTLTDSEAVLDPMDRLRDVYPHILSLRRETGTAGAGEGGGQTVRGRTTEELFGRFFHDVTGEVMSGPQEMEVAEVLAEIERSAREAAR
ncbi:MAG: exonuclease SbcCD subunit D [Gaiellales bacterium]|nr:exonuclease SbcCD subunit D [Gaiellales bacterium]